VGLEFTKFKFNELFDHSDIPFLDSIEEGVVDGKIWDSEEHFDHFFILPVDCNVERTESLQLNDAITNPTRDA